MSVKVFQKYSNIKFNANPSGVNRVFPCEDKVRQKDERVEKETMTKSVVAFRSFAKAPKPTLHSVLQMYVNAIFQPRHSFLKPSLPIRTSAIYAFIKVSLAACPAHFIILSFLQG
jgi:hypothetical protein